MIFFTPHPDPFLDCALRLLKAPTGTELRSLCTFYLVMFRRVGKFGGSDLAIDWTVSKSSFFILKFDLSLNM